MNSLSSLLNSAASYLFPSNKLIEEKLMQELPHFGAKGWSNLGLSVEEPRVPQDILMLLETNCPFWPKKIKETHLLCLIPKELDESELLKLTQNDSIKGIDWKFPQKSYWILITKKVISTTKALNDQAQINMLAEKNYDLPTPLEAVVAILAAKSSGEIALFPKQDEATKCHGTFDENKPIVIGSDLISHFCTYGNNWNVLIGTAGVIRSKETQIIE